MRLLLAGICSYICITLVAVGIIVPLEGAVPEFLLIALMSLSFFVAVFGSYMLFNSPAERWPYQSIEELIDELEKQDLIVSTDFQANRALQVEEYEDEGLHYYLELNDGSVLYLNGQYLYEYEPVEDDPELSRERRFPCTEFTIGRYKTEGYVLDIITRGDPFEPEAIAPSLSQEDFLSHTNIEDGAIIRDKPFDEIKREILKDG